MNLEETNKSKPTYEEFVKFISSLNKNYKYSGTITPSDEAVEEVNKLIEESNKRFKELFPSDNIDNITIDDVGNWTIQRRKTMMNKKDKTMNDLDNLLFDWFVESAGLNEEQADKLKKKVDEKEND